MPKLITPAMRAHLDGETTRLAAIWRITRKDGQQFFFTDHDRDRVRWRYLRRRCRLSDSGRHHVLRRYIVSASAQAGAGVSYTDYAIAAADVGGTTDITVGNLAYDETDVTVIFIPSTDGASVGFLVKFSPEDGIVWVNSEINWSTYSIPRKTKLTQGRIALWEGGSTSTQIHLVDTDTGEIVQSQTGWDSQAGNNLFYDANIQMLVNAHSNGIHQAWPGRATRDTVPLSEVVTDLCARVGLSEDDIDVAQLTDPCAGSAWRAR